MDSIGRVSANHKAGFRSRSQPEQAQTSQARTPRDISIKNMPTNGFLGLFLNLKTSNYLFIGAIYNGQQELKSGFYVLCSTFYVLASPLKKSMH